jgi:acetylornithine deacetylase
MTTAARVGAAVDANWKREIEFLRGLVTRRSTLGDEALVQRFVAAELGELGLEVDTWDIDAASLARLPGYGPVEWSFAGRPNVGARWCGAGGGGRSLVLQGHIDVVPATPEHHWTHDPWGAEVAEGRMWGRGAADMKAGVAAMVYAVRALRDAGVQLRGDVSLVTVIEEECTGNGALSALARGTPATRRSSPSRSAIRRWRRRSACCGRGSRCGAAAGTPSAPARCGTRSSRPRG